MFLIVIGDILVGTPELQGLIPAIELDRHEGAWLQQPLVCGEAFSTTQSILQMLKVTEAQA